MATVHGWTGSMLNMDLTGGGSSPSSSFEHSNAFPGGRLLAARLYWDEVSKGVGALDPDNLLMLMPGPLGGTPAIACSRWVMSAKSPHSYPDQYGFGNGGGFFGAAIKQAGYDGIIVSGAARAPTYVLIEGGRVAFKSASGLWGCEAGEAMQRLKAQHGADARIVCIGPAGERLVRFAVACTDQGGHLSNGMGAVMGSKNLKAIVIRGGLRVPVADPQRLSHINKRIRLMRKGQNESLYMTEPMLRGIEKMKTVPCYGCPCGCMRAVYRHSSGLEEVRQTCAAAFLYTAWDQRYHGEATESPFLATSLCDRFGLCTAEVSNILYWLDACFKAGILSEDATGLPLSQIGSLEFFQALAQSILARAGFGDLLAEGVRRASIDAGPEAEKIALEHVMPSGYVNDAYGARVYMATALLYATEARNPIIQLHEFSMTTLKWILWHTTSGGMSALNTEVLRKIALRAWGSEQAVDFSTYDGKALAAYMIQNRQHAKESLVACDRFYPFLDSDQTADLMGDPGLEAQLFEAVTGQPLSEQGYYRIGERSVNLERAIMGREGKAGRDSDSIPAFNFTEPMETEEGMVGLFNPELEFPGPGDTVISRRGATVDRDAFERMKDEYYALRSWDVQTGLQQEQHLQDLGLGFVCPELKAAGLLKAARSRT